MKKFRYHMTTDYSTLKPTGADCTYFAQMTGDGTYRQCVDVIDRNVRMFERWANKNPGVLEYVKGGIV